MTITLSFQLLLKEESESSKNINKEESYIKFAGNYNGGQGKTVFRELPGMGVKGHWLQGLMDESSNPVTEWLWASHFMSLCCGWLHRKTVMLKVSFLGVKCLAQCLAVIVRGSYCYMKFSSAWHTDPRGWNSWSNNGHRPAMGQGALWN